MLKNLRRIDRAGPILFLRATHPGRVHDQRMADTPPYPRPVGSQRLQDVGVQAFTLDGVASIQPTKNPRGHEWTRAQNAGNRKLSRPRVCIDHVNSRVTRGRRRKETIRMWNAGIRELVMDIGGAWHTFRVRLSPSWTPMASIVMNSIV